MGGLGASDHNDGAAGGWRNGRGGRRKEMNAEWGAFGKECHVAYI